MHFCLVVQKDTLERDTVGAVLNATELAPTEFLSELQTHHCIEYQLIAHTEYNETLEQQCRELAEPYKASFGKNWYQFDHTAISSLVTTFFQHGITVVNFRSIGEIFGVNCQLFPVVDREVVTRPVAVSQPQIQTLPQSQTLPHSQTLPQPDKSTSTIPQAEPTEDVTKDEIVTIIEDLSKTHEKRRDREKDRDRERGSRGHRKH